jgi:hypothetical protein
MQKEIKHIYSFQQLSSLNNQHDEDLMFIWKLRQGIQDKIHPVRICLYAEWFWQTHFQDHFLKEEQELLQVLPADHPMMQKMFDEHEAIQRKIKAVTEVASFEGIERLARIVECYLRFEEDFLFQLIKSLLTAKRLLALNELLQANASCQENWKDEFWINKN